MESTKAVILFTCLLHWKNVHGLEEIRESLMEYYDPVLHTAEECDGFNVTIRKPKGDRAAYFFGKLFNPYTLYDEPIQYFGKIEYELSAETLYYEYRGYFYTDKYDTMEGWIFIDNDISMPNSSMEFFTFSTALR